MSPCSINKYILVVLFTLLHCAVSSYDYARYDNYYLYRVTIENEKHIEVLNALEEYSDSYIILIKTLTFAELIVPPHKFADFHDILIDHAFQFDILSENVQANLDAESTRTRTSQVGFNWLNYHRLDVIYDWMENLAVSYPDNITLLTVGNSYEGRQIKGIKLSYKSGNPGIVLESGMHAREWIAPAVVTYILNEFIFSRDEKVRSIAEHYDWYVIPVTNPDGYEYTHTIDRFWRKTRKPYSAVCFGAHPNRNWDDHWGELGTSSNNPCTNNFIGDKPFSENETASISNYLKSLTGKVQVYIAFHSFKQLLLFPYDYTKKHAPNHDDLQRIGNKAIAALAKRYGTVYKTGNTYETIYPVSGSSMGWAYDKLGAKLGFTYELRPGKKFDKSTGFSLPTDQIIPTGEETLDSLVALLDEAIILGYP